MTLGSADSSQILLCPLCHGSVPPKIACWNVGHFLAPRLFWRDTPDARGESEARDAADFSKADAG